MKIRLAIAITAAGIASVAAAQQAITPLEEAIGKVGYFGPEGVPLVRALVEAGAELNPRKPGAKSALFLAMDKSDDVFQFLLNKGADPNLPNQSGYSPLHYVISTYKDHDKAVMLIAAGAKVNARNEDGDTILMSAAITELVRTVDLLIRKGADVNAKSRRGERTALMSVRSVRMAEKLIEHGADVNARDANGKSVAAYYPEGPILDTLKKHGAVVAVSLAR